MFKRLLEFFPSRSSRFYLVLATLGGAGAGVSFTLGLWLTGATFTILVVNIWISGLFLRRSFIEGWHHGRMTGRMDMRLSLVEAQRRGMSFDQWFVAECERDGIPVVVDGDAPE